MIFGNGKPFEGDERERVIFALFPRVLDDGRIAWLCRVKIHERAGGYWSPGMGYRAADPSQRGGWVEIRTTLP